MITVTRVSLVKILFLSDTHLGFDLPFRPRVRRRRRGDDFFSNFERALEPAWRGEVHMVVHGGDVFYRSRIPAELVQRAFAPLKTLADDGLPIFVVPGNHERTTIPHGLLARHPNVFLFDRPRTIVRQLGRLNVSVSGFPHLRSDVRRRFPSILEETNWRGNDADTRLLCMHHAVERARVGPSNFTFRSGHDVIRTFIVNPNPNRK